MLQNFHQDEENGTDSNADNGTLFRGHAEFLLFLFFNGRFALHLFNHCIRLYNGADVFNLRKNTIRVGSGNTKLLRCIGKNCFAYFIQLIDLTLDLCCTVCAVQIFHDVDFGL